MYSFSGSHWSKAIKRKAWDPGIGSSTQEKGEQFLREGWREAAQAGAGDATPWKGGLGTDPAGLTSMRLYSSGG